MTTEQQHQPRSGFGFLVAVFILLVAALAGLLHLERVKNAELQAALVSYETSPETEIAPPIEAEPNFDNCTECESLINGEKDVVSLGGRTWVAYDTPPVEIVVVNDPSCGLPCDPGQVLGFIRQSVAPVVVPRTVDINSDEGQELLATFDFKQVPSFFAGKGAETIDLVQQNSSFLQEQNGYYYFDPVAFRFPRGKLIASPTFEGMDQEFSKGDGPLQVVEFTAFHCGYCRKLHQEVGPTIQSLIDEGLITYTVKDFPISEPKVHVGANCIGQQGQYWAAHDRLMNEQGTWGRNPDGGMAYVRGIAADLGLDLDVYDTCLGSSEATQEVLGDQAEGRTYGVTGTPSLFIGERMVPGFIDAAQFESIVRAEAN